MLLVDDVETWLYDHDTLPWDYTSTYGLYCAIQGDPEADYYTPIERDGGMTLITVSGDDSTALVLCSAHDRRAAARYVAVNLAGLGDGYPAEWDMETWYAFQTDRDRHSED